MFRRFLVLLWLALVGALAIDTGAAAATKTVGTATYTYDTPAGALNDGRLFAAADAAPTQLSGSREGSASPHFEARAASTTPGARSNATNTATRIGDDVVAAGDDAFTHGHSYHPRIRERGLQDPVGHNFPYSYDDVILRSTPVTQADGSLLYRVPGAINGKDGFFEIAVNPSSGTIFHRTFVGG